MKRAIVPIFLVAVATLLLTSSRGWSDVPAPPVNQEIGQPDVVIGDLTEADCRICHTSGVPDRHHGLTYSPVPDPTLVPYPQFNIDDGAGGFQYSCMSCHSDTFVVERNCLVCHNAGSPHHTTAEAVNSDCVACHGDLVDNPGDGHYIPTYEPSLVTPYRGLNGDGYENKPYPTMDLASDGSGVVVPNDATLTEEGPPFFTQTNVGALGTVLTRSEPNDLSFKPAGDNNDFVIASTHHSGDTFSVVFTAGSPLSAVFFDAAVPQRLEVILDTTQTAQQVVDVINDAIALTTNVDLSAELGYDGEDDVADLLPPEHYEPLGGMPPNSRGFGAGSCSYCHDSDGILDANGQPAGIIWDNHTLHHEIGLPFSVSDGAGGTISRCDLCHGDRSVAGEQSGGNFDFAIRFCERCHGPDSLHNIQTDSPNADNVGTIVVGGEDAGYGHVGRDAGPGDSDCWGCHGFDFGSSSADLVFGPVIPSIFAADKTVIAAGTDTPVTVDGSGFTNTDGETSFESAITLTAADGSSLTLTPDLLLQGIMAVTIPGTTAPGNYDLQAVKEGFASNPVVISITPKVVITDVTADGATVTVNGSGFGGHAAGSGTSVTTSDTTEEATIVSWSDTTIVAAFDSAPNQVTVNSLFGTETSEVGGGVNTWKLRIPLADTADIQVTFLPYNGFLLVEQQINGQRTYGFGMEQDGMIFWFDSAGTIYYGIVDHNAATMWGMVINQGVTSFWYAEQ